MPKKTNKEQFLSGRTSNVIHLPLNNSKKQKNEYEMPHMVSEIQKKVNGSSALNGGFDVLMYKVDKIEETQTKIVETVGSIHQAIYHPDEGLFARINSTKISQNEDKVFLEKKILELDSWKESQDKKNGDDKSSDKEIKDKVQSQHEKIQDLEKWKNNATAASKWLLVALLGGIFTITFRALYELWLSK